MTRENKIFAILQMQDRSIYWLAKEIKMSYQAVFKLVKAETIPDGTAHGTLRRVSRVLKVSIDDLEEEKYG